MNRPLFLYSLYTSIVYMGCKETEECNKNFDLPPIFGQKSCIVTFLSDLGNLPPNVICFTWNDHINTEKKSM